MSHGPVKRQRKNIPADKTPMLVKRYDVNKPPPSEVIDYINESIEDGATVDEAVASLKIPPSVYHKWLENYPDFAELAEVSRHMSLAWYLKQARVNITNPQFQHKTFTYIMDKIFGFDNKAPVEGGNAMNLTASSSVGVRKKEDKRIEVGNLDEAELDLIRRIMLKSEETERTEFDESDIEVEVIEEEKEEDDGIN